MPAPTAIGPPTAATPPEHPGPRRDRSVAFREYFDGDTGRGLGASHRTGGTALAALF